MLLMMYKLQLKLSGETQSSFVRFIRVANVKKQKLLHTDIFLNASTLVNLNLLRYNFVLVYDNSNR